MALQGTLETFALADVLRLLASTKKTGVLRIDGDRGTGEMAVVDGELVGASAQRAPRAERPAEVLFELLRFGDGSFVFDTETAAPAGDHRESVEEALADAEEQLREWREIEAVVPSPTRTITLVSQLRDADITLTARQWSAIVALGDGCHSLDLGDRLGLAELPVTRLVRDLVELGAVEVGAEAGDRHAESFVPTAAVEPEVFEPLVVVPDVPPAPAPEIAPVAAEAPPVEQLAIEPVVAPAPPPAPPAPPAPTASSTAFAAPPPAPAFADPPTSSAFADAPSLLAEPPPPPAAPTNTGPLLGSGGGSTAFAPASAAFAPAPDADPEPVSAWNDDPDDGLSSFHDDRDNAPLFSDSSDVPGPDDPFGPDPFQIPKFGQSPAEAQAADEAAQMARQLANLSPRAQQAVAAAAAANTDEERAHAIDQVERASDEPINRNLLLKYLSSVDE